MNTQNYMDNTFENIEEYKPNKKREILIVFDNMISDMLSNKKLNLMVTELFIREGKLNIYLVFVAQSTFAVLANIILNSTHFCYESFKQKRASTNRI